MTRVVFMCGPAGSGKSTHASILENQGMVRLSIDEEAWRRGHRSHPLDDEVRQEIEEDLRKRLVRFVRDGMDVVLDLSFWSRSMREEYRALLRPMGIEPETIYVVTPRDVVLDRICRRTNGHAHDVTLPEAVAMRYFDHFEVPTAGEGPLTVIEGHQTGLLHA